MVKRYIIGGILAEHLPCHQGKHLDMNMSAHTPFEVLGKVDGVDAKVAAGRKIYIQLLHPCAQLEAPNAALKADQVEGSTDVGRVERSNREIVAASA